MTKSELEEELSDFGLQYYFWEYLRIIAAAVCSVL